MAFSSHLNMGISYDDDKNYFNALMSYEAAISKEYQLTAGLNNIGVTMHNVGLQKQALNKYNRSINYYDNGRGKSDNQPWKYFANRASLFAILDKGSLHNSDIRRAISLKQDYPNSWITKGKFEILNGGIHEGIESFNKAVEVDEKKSSVWRSRAKMFEVLGQYDKAIADYKKAIELSKNPKWSLYELGRVQYLLGDIENAEKNYQAFLSKGLWDQPYNLANKNIGIVQFIDKQKGFGFVFGSTWFNAFDSIFFKLSNCLHVPNKGDRVRFALKYANHKGRFEAISEQIEPYQPFDILKYKIATNFHCIIHDKQNAFKASSDLKYVHIFYPYETLYPISIIRNNLDESLKNSLLKDGYVFAEASIHLQENTIPEIVTLKPIGENNGFRNKLVIKPSYGRRQRYSSYSSYSSWTCSVCDGDASTGCQMSDPQYCPMGRGI